MKEKIVGSGNWGDDIKWELFETETSPDLNLCTAVFAIPITREGKILLVSHKGRSWTFPGGHIEEGESAEEAIFRELKEETGQLNPRLKYFGYQKIIHSQPVQRRDKTAKAYPFPNAYVPHYFAYLSKLNMNIEIKDDLISELRVFSLIKAIKMVEDFSKEYVLLSYFLNILNNK